MTTSGRPSWLDRAVDEALAVCPTMQPWEVRVMLIAAAPTIQNAATEGAEKRVRIERDAGDMAHQRAERWKNRCFAARRQVDALTAELAAVSRD